MQKDVSACRQFFKDKCSFLVMMCYDYGLYLTYVLMEIIDENLEIRQKILSQEKFSRYSKSRTVNELREKPERP